MDYSDKIRAYYEGFHKKNSGGCEKIPKDIFPDFRNYFGSNRIFVNGKRGALSDSHIYHRTSFALNLNPFKSCKCYRNKSAICFFCN